MTQPTKIKKCPHCGKPVQLIKNSPKTVYMIFCKTCNTETYFFSKKGTSISALAWFKPSESKANVLKIWNKRTKGATNDKR